MAENMFKEFLFTWDHRSCTSGFRTQAAVRNINIHIPSRVDQTLLHGHQRQSLPMLTIFVCFLTAF